MEKRTCPSCTTEIAADAAFCTGCGLPVQADAPAPSVADAGDAGDAGDEGTPAAATSARSRRARNPDAVARSRANAEFARTRGIVFVLRAIFVVGCLHALAVLFLLHAANRHDEVPHLGLLTVVLLLEALLMVCCAVAVTRAPLLCSIVNACLMTLGPTLQFALLALDPGVVIGLFFAVAGWAGVMQAARLQRVLRDNPNLQLVRRFDRSRRVEGGVADRRRAERRTEARRSWGGRLRVLGFCAGLIVVLIGLVIWLNLPPAIEDSAAVLRAELAQGRLPARMFVGGGSSRVATNLLDELQRRGWHEQPPQYGEPAISGDIERPEVRFAGPQGELTFRFAFDADAYDWRVMTYTLPPLQAPPLGSADEAFRAAWRAADLKPMQELLSESLRQRSAALERMLKKRWPTERPDLGEAHIDPGRDGRGSIAYELDGDQLRTRWEYRHPAWRITGLTLPRE